MRRGQYLIQGQLVRAERCGRPASIGVGRPRGAKAEGLRYERAFAKEVGLEAVYGQWFHFLDATGWHYCQTDVLILERGMAVVLESKLTWVEEGQRALDRLYRPVVEEVFGKASVGLVVTRNLPRSVRGMPPFICSDLDSAIEIAKRGNEVILHWIPGTRVRQERRVA